MKPITPEHYVNHPRYTYDEVVKASTAWFKGDEMAAQVFAQKYALQDEEERYLELTPSHMFQRLASELARVSSARSSASYEQEYERFLDLLEQDGGFGEVVLQGSPMSAIGNPFKLQSASNCFASGTMVLTVNRGVVPIEQIQPGDCTVTHTGAIKEISQIHKNPLGDRTLFEVRCFRTPSFKVTGNHKMMALTKEQDGWDETPQWTSIENLRVGDWIAIPKKEVEPTKGSFKLDVFDEEFSHGDFTYSVEREAGKFRFATQTKVMEQSHKHWIPSEIPIDKDFAYFLGLWLGDGCVFGVNNGRVVGSSVRNRNTKKRKILGITLTFGLHETRIIQFAENYLGRVGVPFSTSQNTEQNTHQILVCSTALGCAFEQNFGRGFAGKRLHESIFSWDENLTRSLLLGLVDSDGTITSSGEVRVVLSNPDLIRQFYHIARSCGLAVGYSESLSRTGRVNARLDFGKDFAWLGESLKTYDDSRRAGSSKSNQVKVSGGYTLVRVSAKNKVQTSDEFVYTLGVEDDHSYAVEGLISQNCYVVSSPADSYGGIMLSDQHLAQLMKRRAGVGLDLSTIRPKGLATKNAAKTTDGIGVFMQRFSNTCREVAQSGRRGALMLTIDCHHPEVLTFINIKLDESKVTGANISVRYSQEFYDALVSDVEYEQRFPVEPGLPEYQVQRKVKAREVWEAAMQAAWKSAEPGALFWNIVQQTSPSDIYAEEGFASISTNPCFAGDTLVAVADGRGAVPIKQLAEEGAPVPVYSVDPATGIIDIKWGRNPRVTSTKEKLLRVTTDKGFAVDVTPNHGMMLRDGTRVEAKDLQPGMSLSPFKKDINLLRGKSPYFGVVRDTREPRKSRKPEHIMISQFHQEQEWNNKHREARESKWTNGGLVVHHKDYNGLNNAPDNLQIMTHKEHQAYHAAHDTQGTKNGRYSGFTNEQIHEAAMELTKSIERRFTLNEWSEFAAERGLPLQFSAWRQEDFYKNPLELGKACAKELGFDHVDLDPRTVKLLSRDKNAFIQDGVALTSKVCANCGEHFTAKVGAKKFCSTSCGAKSQAESSKRKESIARGAQERQQATMTAQARMYSDLAFKGGSRVLQREWEEACKAQGIPTRIGKALKFGFRSWSEVKEAGENYNHKVISVEALPGEHQVYNITVDDNHTLAVVQHVTSKQQGLEFVTIGGVNTWNCGEIVLNANDSCRLTALNLKRFVTDPFLSTASFDFDRFERAAYQAQEIMDLVIDLEAELIDRIIAKIDSDPEPEHIKLAELNLWKEIKRVALAGRRTGLGFTALGDAMAMVGIRYGSDESVVMAGEVARRLNVGAFKASVDMAERHGAFPIFKLHKELGHPWIERLLDACGPETREKFVKFGRRNISLTTIAPTGTVSIMTQSTSGVEPVFMPYYTRRRKLSDHEIAQGLSVDFVDQSGDKWHEYPVFHHELRNWLIVQGVQSPEALNTDELRQWTMRSPYWGATAMDQQWEKGVEIQAACQLWISHSISRTANLPNDAPVELVDRIYRAAWASGCKGYTVYRDGSRSGVLVSADQSTVETTIPFNDAPKRPEVLPVDVHHVRYKGEEWTVLVGLLEGEPFEVFAGPVEDLPVPPSVQQAEVRKHARKSRGARYELVWDDGQKNVRDIAKALEAEHNTLTRLTSLSLRHGAKIQFVVEQLQRDESSFLSFSRVLARTLKTYIPEGTKASQAAFSDCSTPELCEPVYSEGCLSCKGCGKSKCG